MTTITEARAELVTLINDAVRRPVLPYVPGTLHPPCVLVVPAEPYITAEDTFNGARDINYEVLCIGGTAPNQQATTAIDDMLDAVLAAIPDATGAGQPYMAIIGDRAFYAAAVPITLTIT